MMVGWEEIHGPIVDVTCQVASRVAVQREPPWQGTVRNCGAQVRVQEEESR